MCRLSPRRIADRAKQDIARTLSPRAVGDLMRRRLEAILQQRSDAANGRFVAESVRHMAG